MLNSNLESDVVNFTPKHIRSTLAKLQCGILPLRLETGRFVNCKEDDRVCELCYIKIVNEKHFICNCPLFHEE